MTEDTQSTLSADDKIELERQARNKQRLKMIGGALALVVMSLLVFALFKVLSGKSETPVASDQASQQAVPESVDTEAARNEFKDALAEFEQRIQPYLDDEALQNWAKKEIEQLTNVKATLLADFAQGKYSSALQQLKQVEEKTLEVVSRWEQAFTVQLNQAQKAFDEDRISLARITLQKASEIKPQEQSVQALQARIDAYAQVSEYIRKYEIGVAENDLAKQVNALSSALDIDPQRQELKPLIDNAKTLLSRQQLENSLAVAEQALTDKDFPLARKAYVDARQLAPNNPAVNALKAKLDAFEKQQSLNNTLSRVQSLADDDAWEQVAQYTQQGLTRFPGNGQLGDMNQQAAKILAMTKQLEGFLARPERLTDSGIRANAKVALKDSISMMTRSEGLARKITSLGALIKEMESTVDLIVTSDERTHIVVKGKGIIGKTKNKTVPLQPGTYTLEATREGFRSKLVNITLTPGQVAHKVHLVCDQEI